MVMVAQNRYTEITSHKLSVSAVDSSSFLMVFPPLLPLRHGTEAGAQHRRCLRLGSLGDTTEAAALQVVPGQQRLNLLDVARTASEAWAQWAPGPLVTVDDEE